MALLPIIGNSIWDGPHPTDAVLVFYSKPASSFAGAPWAMANPNVDWKETHSEHVIKVDVPGLKKEEVHVQIENARTLFISGQRHTDEVNWTDTWHRVERRRGHFIRKFNLPENAKVDDITAKVESGVLTVLVPKHGPEKENIRTIKIDGIGGDGGQQAAAI